MEGQKKKELRLREMPVDVYTIVMEEQNKQRMEKGRHIALDSVIYAIIRKFRGATLAQHS